MNTLAAFMVVSINHSTKQCDLWIKIELKMTKSYEEQYIPSTLQIFVT